VVTALTLSTLIIMGLSSSFGIFFKPFQQEFDLSRASTSSILSVRMALGCAFALLGGWATDRYGPRVVLFTMGILIGISLVMTGLANEAWQLFITYGLIMAAGVGAVYVVMSSTILRWFGRRRGLALGIASSGGGLGMVAMSPIAAYLIESLQWRGALMILGAIAWFTILPISRLLKKEPQEVSKTSETSASDPEDLGQQRHSMVKVFGLRSFWVFLFVWVLMAFSMFFVLAHIVPHAADMGFSAVESATVLSLVGMGMVVGRLFTGLVTEKVGARSIAIFCSLLQIAALLLVIRARNLPLLYVLALIYGFAQGGFSVSTTMLAGYTFGLSHIGKIFGLLEVGFSAGAALGPLVGGLIFDAGGKYAAAFLIMGAAVLANIFFVALIKHEDAMGKSP
jgi:MFS family permease